MKQIRRVNADALCQNNKDTHYYSLSAQIKFELVLQYLPHRKKYLTRNTYEYFEKQEGKLEKCLPTCTLTQLSSSYLQVPTVFQSTQCTGRNKIYLHCIKLQSVKNTTSACLVICKIRPIVLDDTHRYLELGSSDPYYTSPPNNPLD